MKKFAVILLVNMLCACSIPVVETVKAQDQAMQKTLVLSEEIKQFEKSIGMEPSAALEKSADTTKARSMLLIYLQKRGLADIDGKIIKITVLVDNAKEGAKILEQGINSEDYSIYTRQENEFEDPQSTITKSFTKKAISVQAEILAHEDWHANLKIKGDASEAIVTPLGLLTALKFFEYKRDKGNAEEIRKSIAYERGMSVELYKISADAKNLFSTMPLAEARQKLLDMIKNSKKYPNYAGYSGWVLNDKSLEARLGQDYTYWKYFDKIITLYEKTYDFRAFVSDLKALPADESKIEKYLDELDAKYSVHNTPTPLPSGGFYSRLKGGALCCRRR